MPHVMAERCHSENASPIQQFFLLTKLRKKFSDFFRNILIFNHCVEHSRGKIHHAERMLEPLMRGTRVNQIG